MSDTNHTDDTTEQPEYRPAAPDAYAALTDLLGLVADPRAFKKRLLGLHRALAAVDEGQAKLARDREVFANYEKTRRTELDSEAAELQKRRVAIAATEAQLENRHEMLGEMHRDLAVREDNLKRRVLALRNIDVIHGTDFCPLPGWPEVDSMIGDTDHAQPAGESVTARPEHSPPDSQLTQTIIKPAGSRVRPSRRNASVSA